MKRYLIAAVAASLVFGSFLAVAATFGGLSVDNLGAESSVIAACDTDGVTTTFTIAYDSTDARDEVTATTVGGVDVACAGQDLTVTLTNAANASLDTTTVTAVTGSNTVSTTTPPAAGDVVNVHVVING